MNGRNFGINDDNMFDAIATRKNGKTNDEKMRSNEIVVKEST